MNNCNYAVLIVLLVSILGCKTTQKTIPGKANLNLTTKALIKANAQTAPQFKTLTAKIKVDYTKADDAKNVTLTLRMKKDSIIWLNAPFNVMRILITPKKVAFYNKLDNTFFEGDFSLLSSVLGSDIDFNKLQNILLGQALYPLEKDRFEASVIQNNYLLKPKVENPLFKLSYVLNPVNFKIITQEIIQNGLQQQLKVDYKSYQNIDEQWLPHKMILTVLEITEQTTIALEFNHVALNQPIHTPFKIPEGYKPITL